MKNGFFSLHCPDCGEKITEEDQHCPRCGVDLDASIGEPLTAQQHFEEARQAYDYGKDLEFALQECAQALLLQPDWAEAHNLRGLILDALKQSDDAIHAYHEALRLDPTLSDARANLEDAERERQNKVPDHVRQNRIWKILLGIYAAGACIALLAGSWILFQVGQEYFGPRSILIFEPDYSSISTVSQAELQETVEILTERAKQLGYKRVKFTVTEENEIRAELPISIESEAFATRIQSIGLVEFVDFGDSRKENGEVVITDTNHPSLISGPGISYHTIMTNLDIQSASLGVDQMQRPVVDFVLTEKGKTIFHEYTRDNIGSFLGIVVDKVVISCPYVNGAIPDGQGQISGLISEEEAEELVLALGTKPLPIPIRLKDVQ